MKVKPEHLKVANSVANIKECGGTTAKKNYWNGVHLLETRGRYLVLKTTDGSLWIEWMIPIEGDPLPLKVLVQAPAFESSAKYVDGGSLEVTHANRIVTLSKGQFRYPLREENPQEYTDPNPGNNPVTWTTDAKALGESLKFISGFIDETHPNANKSVATLYSHGLLTGGNPQKIAMVRGLQGNTDISFKARTARAVGDFLTKIGNTVEVSITDTTYKFRCPEVGHYVIVLAEGGRFTNYEREVNRRITEINQIDRKTLLARAQVFAGAMREGVDRLNLSFRGALQQASLRVHTPGEGDDVATDEFSIYRTVPPLENRPQETEDQIRARVPGPVDVSLTREYLVDTLSAMSGTTVTFKCIDTRMIQVEDEKVQGEDGRQGPERSVILTTRRLNAEGQTNEAPAAPAVQPPVNETQQVAV